MSAPTLLAGTATDKTTFSGGSGTVSAPAGRSTGDLLILVLTCRNSVYPGDTGITGYTYVTKVQQYYGTPICAVFKRTATGDSSDDVALNLSNYWFGTIEAISGHDTTTPIHVTATNVGGYDGTAAPLPSVTTTVDDCLLIGIPVGYQSGTLTTSPTASGYTQDAYVATGGYTVGGVFHKAAGAAGSYGGEAATWSGGKTASIMVAIAPAAGGGGPTYTLTAAAGSYALTGTATPLLYNRVVGMGAGAYTLTGQAVALLMQRALAAGPGTYTFTGTDVTLTYSGTTPPTYTLSVGAGTYVFTGTDAELLRQYALTAASGNYALTGTAIGLLLSRRLALDIGSYAFTGSPVGLSVILPGAISHGLWFTRGLR